jgi:hypothetical protein
MRSKCVALLALVAAACGQDSSTVIGLVIDRAGAPLSGVTVLAGEQRVTTDPRGRFRLTISSSGTTVLTFQRPDRAEAYRAVTPRGAKRVTVGAQMVEPTLATTVDVRTAGATVNAPGGLVLELPQGSLRTASGGTPDAPVSAAVTWLDRNNARFWGPVPLIGIEGTVSHPLETYGMFDLSLSHRGERVVLAPGATLRMRAPASSGDPPAADLFSIDVKLGLWKPEGTATNAGGSWTAEIPHLSWWNIDRFLKVPPAEQCCVRFRARTSTGEPRSGVLIVVWPPFAAMGTTDANGVLCEARFPCGSTLQVSYGVYLNESAETFVEGTITVTPNVRGSCSGQCQDVDLDTRCTEDRHCGPGQTCKMGECEGPTGGGGPTGARASCIDSRGVLCIEYRGSQINLTQARQSCEEQGATYREGSGCTTLNAVGSCRLNAGTGAEIANVWYAPIQEAEAQQTCQAAGGAWQPI